MEFGKVSYWHTALGGASQQRASLAGLETCDVCIVGAGYSGLWTAYYLTKADPTLSILIIEKEFVGYGASGRNGGWLTGSFPWGRSVYARDSGRAAVSDMVQALHGSVAEVIRVADAEGIDADIHPTQELTIATNPGQLARMQADLVLRRGWGEGEDQLYAIDATHAQARVAVPGVLGALVETGVARLQPAKLVRGLARVVESLGVRIVEGIEVETITPGRVTTTQGDITAGMNLRATEGYTANFKQYHRDWVPLNSAQIVTEPLPQELWDQIGWQGGELLGDMSHIYCYCQRTPDGRIVVGSRGVPYLWGSRTDTDGHPDAVTVDRLRRILQRYFPKAAQVDIAHAWCGVLGVPRDWCATVGFDPQTQIGWAGGYGGVGVSTSNLAGRTLADLMLGRDSALTALPWVNRRVRRWEPEPIRWLGIRGKYGAMHLKDWWERR